MEQNSNLSMKVGSDNIMIENVRLSLNPPKTAVCSFNCYQLSVILFTPSDMVYQFSS